MVFPDDFLHFLKIKNFFCWIHQNYLVALIANTDELMYMLHRQYNAQYETSEVNSLHSF